MAKLKVRQLLKKILQWMAAPNVPGNLTVGGAENLTGSLTVGGAVNLNSTGEVNSNGALHIKTENKNISQHINWDGKTTPSSIQSVVRNVFEKTTRNGWIGQFGTSVYPDAYTPRKAGAVASFIGARHYKPTNPVANYFIVGVNPDGTKYYTVSDDQKFRDDLGITSLINAKQNTLSVSSSIDIASYIRSSTGTFVSGNLRTYGKIAHLRLVFKNNGTIAKNGVVYAATISSYKPVQQVIGVGSNGGNAVVCSIDGSGNISARNCGASASFTDTAVAFTYIMP